MYNILLIGSHLGYNLEHYVEMTLEKFGHLVTFFGYRDMLGTIAFPARMAITRFNAIRTLAEPLFLNKVNKRLREEAFRVEPDLVLTIKGEAVLPSTVEWFEGELGAKTALWYPDDPRYFDSLVRYIAPHYGYVFASSEKAVEMYKEIGVKNVYYLPFACETSVHRSVRLTEEEMARYESDVCFVGSYLPRRARIINKLKKFNIKVYGPYWDIFAWGIRSNGGIWGPEMVKVFNAAKIVLNVHVGSDLDYKPNMRVFEATGCGSFLLTDCPYGLESLFRVGEELVCYNDGEELVELVKYFLENESERKQIAQRGRKRAYGEHTYANRVSQMIMAMHV